MKRGILVVSSLLIWTLAAQAATVECQVQGRGSNRDKALQNALLNAVIKVHGAAVGTGVAQVAMDTGDIAVDVDTGTGSRHISMDRVAVQSASTLTLMEAQGLIKSYEVVSEQQLEGDTYEMTVDVWVLDYQSPEDIKEIRLAVLPTEVTANNCRFGPVTVPGGDVERQFTQYLTGALSQNDRFTLLDRESDAALMQERRLLARTDIKPEERSRLQATLGADYLVVVTLPQASLLVEEKDSPIIGRPIRTFDARLRAEYRLVVGPTRQVAMADDLRIHLEDNQVKELAEDWRSDDIDYAELQSNFLRLAAGRVAMKVAEYLAPIKVAAVMSGTQVILNQGGTRFVAGDQFRVYRLGQSVIDPDTQMHLATEEEPLGVIRITRVLPKVSYAEVVEGTFDDATVGSVCRHLSGIEDTNRRRPGNRRTNTRTTKSGGVKLPFD